MGLIFWTPLNGNYINYGLGEYPNIVYNGTLEAHGKTGSCYAFSQRYFRINGGIIAGLDSFSIACWAYLTSTNYQIFTFETSGAWWQFVLEKDYLRVRDTVTGISGSRLNIPITPIPQNTWVHVVVVYDKGNIYVYQGGVLKDVLHGNINASMNAENTVLCIGADVANSTSVYPGNCKVNDFRVYDHCLSAREVKELSKGLIVHYKLSENCQTMDNCYSNPTFNTSSQTGGWSHWASAGAGSCSQNTDKDYIYNKNNAYSHKLSYTGSGYYLCYQSPVFEGGYRSAQAIIKLSDGSEPDTSKIRFDWNAGVGTAPATRFFSLGDGFYLMKVEGFRQSGSNDLVGIRIVSGVTVYISEAYLENDRMVCSDILANDQSVIVDRSGYGRDAARMTPLTVDTASPRYDKCLVNAGNYPLRATFDFPESNGLTVACWVNMGKWGYQGSGIFSTTGQIASTPTDYNTTTFNHYDGYIRLRGTNGTTYSIKLGTTSTSDVPVNVWKHVVFTHDGSTVKLYINGSLIRSQSVPTPLVAFKRLYLGTSYAGGTNRNCLGKWSDFRMYATALSAEDIKELYSVSASVDNLGNLHCYEAEELAENLFKAEYINEVAEKSINWVKRNDEHALALKPTNFYEGGVYAHILQGKFKPNTQYKFDLWMDVDEVVSSGTNRPGGLLLYYTDGTRTPSATGTGSLTMKGSSSSPKGFQHKVFYSDPDKSVDFLITYYYTSNNVYYRYDSVIIPMLNPTSFKKTGTVETGQFREDATMAGICKGDNFDINRMIEK